ncbi:MAG: serine/threonine-protein kinase [Isosphaeraceae bacterium]
MARLEDFLADIDRSGLVTPQVLRRLLLNFPREPEQDAAVRFARLLIQRQTLTPYQTRKLLSGVTRGFFLGGYRILRPLGAGGMGKVFLASRDREGTEERVAIKVLPPKKALEEGQALLRFQREVELSQRARHPNLARILDFGAEDGAHYMVLEYIPGESLYETVRGPRGGPLRVTDASRLFVKILSGLDAAHAAGLVHRDIKPSNIMITPDGNACLLDLGLARATDDEQPLTRPNLVVGTLDYASPEQLTNASSADRRSDLYSIGCTLYFTLAGRPPFEGGDIVNKIFKQRMEDPEPLERVARGVPATYAAIVRKLMAKNPDDRHASCQELQKDLIRWTDPEKVRALLGAAAESSRLFRPPAVSIEEDDLQWLADNGPTGQPVSLRELGDAEPGTAPFRRPPPTAVPAILVPPGPRGKGSAKGFHFETGQSTWLYQFIAVAVVLGLLAVLAITLLL